MQADGRGVDVNAGMKVEGTRGKVPDGMKAQVLLRRYNNTAWETCCKIWGFSFLTLHRAQRIGIWDEPSRESNDYVEKTYDIFK